MSGRKGRTRAEIREDQANGKTNQGRRRRANQNHKGMAIATQIAEAQGLDLHAAEPTSTLDALQLVLDRSVALLKWAIDQTDQVPQTAANERGHDEAGGFWLRSLDANGNTVFKPHEKYELETSLRKEVMELASRMEGLDIADRRTRLAEAQATVVQRFMKSVLDRLNLTSEQQAALGPAMRAALPLIEGTASVVPSHEESQAA
jgi:hypothetical protein